jgi:GDP-L-fucose synthase|tara:strand:- start:1904 stop:2845 length:942 start_codon:yes stop_codon:yes gene_type:complete
LDKKDVIFIAGHNGMVGSAIHNLLKLQGYTNILTAGREELDLTNQQMVEEFFIKNTPEYVFLAAAKVGGIHANNSLSGDFLYENIMIQNNVIHYANKNNVKKLLFLGSSCIYPKTPQIPINEESLLSGKLEPTNKSYAIAKIAGIEMCQSYRRQYGLNAISIMPTNLYGPNDNFSLDTSHVLAAFIRKFHDAKLDGHEDVTLWGDGSPYREFLHVEDMAIAAILCMEEYEDSEIINIGVGEDLQIKELSNIVSKIIGYEGNILWDDSKPNGTPRKLLDNKKILNLGWKPQISLENGIKETYSWFKNNFKNINN